MPARARHNGFLKTKAPGSFKRMLGRTVTVDSGQSREYFPNGAAFIIVPRILGPGFGIGNIVVEVVGQGAKNLADLV